MNYNPRRGRSPPPQFFYDDPMRPVTNQREYENPYRISPQMYGGPGRHYPVGAQHPMEMPPMHMHPHAHVPQPVPHHPFMEGPNPGNCMPSFSEPYYDAPPPPNPYHTHMGYRDPRFSLQPNQMHPNPSRSSSPPYKILCITNINQKVGDGPVKDALISDFGRFGDISVSVCHDNGERLAYIYFRNCDDAREARQFKARTMFFDRPIEIEPIYEQLRSATSPNDLSPASPMIPPSGLPIYSPRRRSISPTHYQRDMTDTMNPRQVGPRQPPLGSDAPPSPIMYSQHRGPSPGEYCTSTPGVYPEDSRTPPSLVPAHHERRSHHATYNNYRSSHMTSPYSSPAHEQYRSSNRSPSNQSPYSAASSGMLHRERAHIPSRSPTHDLYHSVEHRGPPASHSAHHHHHSSSRSSSSNHQAPHPTQQTHSNSSHRNQQSQRHHRNHPPDPPARFTSRDFRRGKFGPDHTHEHDDSRPSRVLLINNIDASKTDEDLREAFEPFGMIEEMEIKKVASDISSALIKFSSMDGAYKAKTANNGRRIGNLRCRIVYGKVTASKRLWIGGLSPITTVSSMEDECSRYGDIVSIDYTSGRPYSYVEYETANQAQFAAHHLRTTLISAAERKIRIEFVDPERSEKLAPRHGLDGMPSLRKTTESLYDIDTTSPNSVGGRKRSTSPANEISLSKRLCPVSSDIPPIATSTFKQERLAAAAAAAAKARTNSTTSSLASHPTSEKSDKIHDISELRELNNKSDNDQPNNGDLSTPNQVPSGDVKLVLEAPSADKLLQCASIREIVHCCAVSWPGQIALRNFIFPAQIYMCSGQKQVIDRYLCKPAASNGDQSYPLLRITQRWRLHPQPKLEEVKRRMQSGNLGMLIITARQENTAHNRQSSAKLHQNGHPTKAGSNIHPQTASSPDKNDSTPTPIESMDGTVNDISVKNGAKATSTPSATPDATTQDRMNTTSSGSPTQPRPIRNLISYLEQKDAAGVVSLSASDVCEQQTSGPSNDNSPKLLYTFPPGEFALNLLKRMATNLTPDSLREEYLLGVIVGGNVESSKV